MFEIVLRIAFFLIGMLAGFICGILFCILHKAEKELENDDREIDEI